MDTNPRRFHPLSKRVLNRRTKHALTTSGRHRIVPGDPGSPNLGCVGYTEHNGNLKICDILGRHGTELRRRRGVGTNVTKFDAPTWAARPFLVPGSWGGGITRGMYDTDTIRNTISWPGKRTMGLLSEARPYREGFPCEGNPDEVEAQFIHPHPQTGAGLWDPQSREVGTFPILQRSETKV